MKIELLPFKEIVQGEDLHRRELTLFQSFLEHKSHAFKYHDIFFPFQILYHSYILCLWNTIKIVSLKIDEGDFWAY